MTTRTGRLIERASYRFLFMVAFGTIILSTVYFVFAPSGHGLKSHNFGDALYFCIVTFTSLGYGDLTPSGFGRVVASLVILFGLATTALLIGRIASERQSSLLLLLYTSDVQRRLASFTEDLKNKTEKILSSDQNISSELRDAKDLLQAVTSYISFNSFQANAVDFGNFTALSILYEALDQKFDALMKVLRKGNDADVMVRALSCARSIERLIALMSRLHDNNPHNARDRSVRRLRSREAAASRAHKLRIKIKKRLEVEMIWIAKGLHAVQLNRVYDAMPFGNNWPTGIHRVVAHRLDISPSMVSKCVDRLILEARLPK